ncbi:hypothetical protein [Thermohalobacter berrensis]|nr:hypothetical protein [Thermohalobacter berrensis]
MKKLTIFIKRNGLKILSLAGLLVGTSVTTTGSLLLSQQVKCPKELLK